MNIVYIILISVLIVSWLIGILIYEVGTVIHLLFVLAVGLVLFAVIRGEKK